MANPIGRWRRRALATRRSPYQTGQMVCTACTQIRRARGRSGFQVVRRCRLLHEGIERPGVQCPRCGLAWIEQEDQPERADE